MEEGSIGFTAKAPVSAWNKRIGVDYPGVFKALLKAGLAVATANAPGAISAAIDGLLAFRQQETPLPPAELAWLLIRRALARAMTELALETARRHEISLGDKNALANALDKALDAVEIRVGVGLLDRPTEHPVVDAVKPYFHRWLMGLGLSSAEATSISHRFGAYFSFALRREWAEHEENYQSILARLQDYDSHFARADRRERAWIRNSDYLQRLIRQPVFDEAFGLEQIYVPLRAWYQETLRSPLRGGRGLDDDGVHQPHRVVVDLEQHLDNWLTTADPKDAIRVISGGPGSGKTTVAKMWTAHLAAEGHRVLYVPLYRLDFRDRDPQRALADFVKDWNIISYDPLDAREGEKHLLLLFDGLDELVMQGRAGQEVARDFVEAITRRIDAIHEIGDRLVQVVFSGRDITVATAERLLGDHQVLHVLPYHGFDPGTYAKGRELLNDPRYGCDRWWQRFGQAVGESYEGLPKPLQIEDLIDVTAQPLLNYLLALGYRRDKFDFATAPNSNVIYADLLAAVYDRTWGLASHPTTKALTREEFDYLLDEIALAAWQGSGRVVTESEVALACERAGLTEQLARLHEGARAGAIGLLAAFYFRQVGWLAGERTFEFTHRSFCAFLAARRIVRSIGDISEMRALHRANRMRGWSQEEAEVRWTELVGPAPIDADLFAFLAREVTLREAQQIEIWWEDLLELFSDQLPLGLPVHRLPIATFREMVAYARNAEEGLLASHFACASVIRNIAHIPWPDRFALRDLLYRLAQRQGESSFAAKCLGWIDASSQELSLAHLVGANMEGSNLAGANLRGANLAYANLRYAMLDYVDLSASDLSNANLEAASLRYANLERCDLSFASLKNADLTGANILLSTLEGTNFEGSCLKNVKFSRGFIYLKQGELAEAQKISDLAQEFAASLGLELLEESEIEPGSWHKRVTYALGRVFSNQDVQNRARTVEDVIFGHADIDVSERIINMTATMITALNEMQSDAIIDTGLFVFLKVTDQNGRSRILGKRLRLEDRVQIEQDPTIMDDPSRFLHALGRPRQIPEERLKQLRDLTSPAAVSHLSEH